MPARARSSSLVANASSISSGSGRAPRDRYSLIASRTARWSWSRAPLESCITALPRASAAAPFASCEPRSRGPRRSAPRSTFVPIVRSTLGDALVQVIRPAAVGLDRHLWMVSRASSSGFLEAPRAHQRRVEPLLLRQLLGMLGVVAAPDLLDLDAQLALAGAHAIQLVCRPSRSWSISIAERPAGRPSERAAASSAVARFASSLSIIESCARSASISLSGAAGAPPAGSVAR